MFHDPGECHMSDQIFVHHKRWHSVSFEELQKESPNFQRADLRCLLSRENLNSTFSASYI